MSGVVKIGLCGDVRCMTAFPPRTDIRRHASNDRFVPLPDPCTAANSAFSRPRCRRGEHVRGTVSASCFAVLRFQNELEMSCMTGMSAGRCPFEDLTNTALAPQSRGVDDGGPARDLAADIGCK